MSADAVACLVWGLGFILVLSLACGIAEFNDSCKKQIKELIKIIKENMTK